MTPCYGNRRTLFGHYRPVEPDLLNILILFHLLAHSILPTLSFQAPPPLLRGTALISFVLRLPFPPLLLTLLWDEAASSTPVNTAFLRKSAPNLLLSLNRGSEGHKLYLWDFHPQRLLMTSRAARPVILNTFTELQTHPTQPLPGVPNSLCPK